MEIGKAASMDGIAVEMLQIGDVNTIDWLLRILNRCVESGVVPESWKASCIVPVQEGKL